MRTLPTGFLSIRMIPAIALLVMSTGAWGQNTDDATTTSPSPTMSGDFQSLVWDTLPSTTTPAYAPAPTPPQAYNGCLVADDGVTPIVCANSDVERPLPKGVVWRDDPDAREGAPQHCLWWETGQTFVGTSEPAVCRDGSLAMPTPMAKRNASPLDTPRHRPTPLTRP